MRYEIITNKDGYIEAIKHNLNEMKNIYELDLSKYDFSGLRKFAYKLEGKELVFDEEHYQFLINQQTQKSNIKEIEELKQKLNASDYLVARTFEQVMELSNPLTWIADVIKITADFRKKYKETISNRKKWREKIEELENEGGNQ